MAVAVHHLHLDTLLILPSHSDRACALGRPQLASALVMVNLGHSGPDGMVWYGSVNPVDGICVWCMTEYDSHCIEAELQESQ